ncbi:protein jagunal [Folsomia candida]|uniref:Protein jagunal n=1 Tax=Folsomia candida TaxID=158441 RepID=A0A226DXV4_FOLCA|nr:protein jagunal [Folsomia candida]XP_021958370.1 protein jagunal [Folsomia candida]OXA50305.1 Protein jagunal [Folsomia candida]
MFLRSFLSCSTICSTFSRTMASRNGPTVSGTDGNDFLHRQKVATQYQLSSVNKSRLKTCIFVHIVLFLVMLFKLLPDILDRVDIFVMEVEELEIPKPLKWEYWWCVSLPVAFVGLSSIRKNNVQSLQIYLGGITANGLIPVLYALYYYFGDVYKYIDTRSTKGIQTWMGYPYAILWYAFLVVALQVHGASIFFSSKLVSAWRLKKTT